MSREAGHPAADGASGDEAITADRSERKYLVAAGSAPGLVRDVDVRLSRHRHRRAGVSPLPGAQHFVTTVYFDTDQRDVYETALANEVSTKLRAKEYYDLHPDLTEVATSAAELVRYTPVVWLELKHKEGTRTQKHRVGIPKRDIAGFFSTGEVSAQMVAIQREAYGEAGTCVLDELCEFCSLYPIPLRADCLVNYRRNAWQDEAGRLRVTIDRRLTFFAPSSDLWSREHALVCESLGPRVGREPQVVVEVKSLGDPPEWLTSLLELHEARSMRFSKFLSASRAVHG